MGRGMAPAMQMRREDGFTLIEVMVAMLILVIGLLGAMTVLTQASSTSSTTQAREQGVSLDRELVEAARGIPYASLTPNTVAGNVASASALADSDGNAAGWQIKRRGIVFTVAMGVCSVDDPQDKLGADDAATFCRSGATPANAARCQVLLGSNGSIAGTAAAASAADAGDCGIDRNLDGTVDGLTGGTGVACAVGAKTCDQIPDDYKRIVVLVRWTTGEGSKYVLQSSTVPYPGFSAAPAVTSLTPQDQTITSPTTTSQGYGVTTNRDASGVAWSLDGTPAGAATGSGQAWAFTFDLGAPNVADGASPSAGEVFDGTYIISAKALDKYGTYGQARATTLTLNRRRAYKPPAFQAVHVGTTVAVDWTRSPERDVTGYKVYRQYSGNLVLVCDIASADQTSCTDLTPPLISSLRYVAVALDKDALGNTREGDQAQSAQLDMTQAAPLPPIAPVASRDAGGASVTIRWTASLQAGVTYRIYRDGTALNSQYATSSTTSYQDTKLGTTDHVYAVSSVDARGAESIPVQAVGP